MKNESQTFRLRSFVRRDSRITAAQARAYEELWPQFGQQIDQGLIDYDMEFGRKAARFLEIGFGSGHSLLALAKSQPECDFIGVETHKPGIGALLLGMEAQAITNLRIYHGDVIDVLTNCIPMVSLDGIQIFFPDPWQKRRHHLRRLIQPDFVSLLVERIKVGASLHLATDWEDYARHMMQVVSSEKKLLNLAGEGQYGGRSAYRPIITKFERRAVQAGRAIWELQLAKKGLEFRDC